MKFVLAFALIGICFAFYFEAGRVNNRQIDSWQNDPKGDCGIVVTGGPGRIREGVDLLSRRQIQKLIISGVHPQAELIEIFPQLPYYGELKVQDIVLERYSRTTFGNARQSRPLIEALNCRSVVLVTSRMHMYRTLRTFQAHISEDVQIIPHTIGEHDIDHGYFDLFVESMKSLFYSLFAYR